MFTQYYDRDKNLFTIHQGEASPIYFTFTDDEGAYITPSNCADISISVSKCEKRYSRRVEGQNIEITFDSVANQWVYWLTQADSYRLPAGEVPVEVFIKINTTNIPVLNMDPIFVIQTQNKVVL